MVGTCVVIKGGQGRSSVGICVIIKGGQDR